LAVVQLQRVKQEAQTQQLVLPHKITTTITPRMTILITDALKIPYQ
jgi:hypothetical protein